MPNAAAPDVTTLLRAGRLLEGFTPEGAPLWYEDAGLAIAGGRVASLGGFAALSAAHPGARVIAGDVVIPGLINAHHHVGLTPLQLGAPDHPLELWFASRLALRDIDLRLDTLFSAFEMIASGVTTVQHLHSRAPGGQEQVVGAAAQVIGAYREIGLRASYSMALRDQNRLVYEDDAAFTERVPEALRPALRAYFERFTLPLAEQVAVFEAIHALPGGDPRIAVQVAPANLHWLSDAALEAAARLSERHRLPMHMHLLETPYQKAYAKRRTGGSALAHLHRLGLTGPLLTIGHGVWMSEADIELCAHSGTRLCHNCSSNLRLKSGVAPVNRFLAAGIPVALGMDEAGINDDRDMLQEMRLALRLHREPGIAAPHPTPAQVLRMATEHGAGTTPFGGRIGRLSPGCFADAVIFDWSRVTRPWQSPDIPPLDVLVQRAKADSVKSVMVSGEVIYADGVFTRVDREAVLAEIAARLAQPLTPAEEERRVLARDVFPHVARFYEGWLDGLGDEPHYRVSGRR
jgi:5-methylthioadenosine/S-adenosylhomocysteine deaminase